MCSGTAGSVDGVRSEGSAPRSPPLPPPVPLPPRAATVPPLCRATLPRGLLLGMPPLRALPRGVKCGDSWFEGAPDELPVLVGVGTPRTPRKAE